MKGNMRLNGKRIKRLPIVDDASKTECEMPEYMKRQRFTDKEIAVLQKKLRDWELKNNK